MKNVLVFLTLFIMYNSFSQQVVVDPGVVSALWTNHFIQNASLNNIKSEQKGIKKLQSAINIKLLQMKALQQKTYNSLRKVTAVVKQAKKVVFASTVVVDIRKYQTQMIQTAQGNPLLYTVALKTELALINKTYDLYTYISTATTGGDANLMSNTDRIKIINYVLDELRAMRGIAYSINRKMRTAKYSGVFKALLKEFNVSLWGINDINRLGIVNDVMPN